MCAATVRMNEFVFGCTPRVVGSKYSYFYQGRNLWRLLWPTLCKYRVAFALRRGEWSPKKERLAVNNSNARQPEKFLDIVRGKVLIVVVLTGIRRREF